jgi:hypothetical protein
MVYWANAATESPTAKAPANAIVKGFRTQGRMMISS